VKSAIVALCVIMAPAFALAQEQQTEHWTDPSGRVSFAIVSHGWQILDPVANAELYSEQTLMVTGPIGSEPGDAFCVLEELIQGPLPRVSRERMNEATRALGEAPSMRERLGRPGFDLDRMEAANINEVTVLSVYGQYLDLDTIVRQFFLYRAEHFSMYTLICSADATDNEGVAQMHAVTASLNIAEAGAEP
jgi:hypothetical protein